MAGGGTGVADELGRDRPVIDVTDMGRRSFSAPEGAMLTSPEMEEVTKFNGLLACSARYIPHIRRKVKI